MNITSALLLGLAIGLVCVFAALAFFVSRITSVRVDTANAIEKVNGRIDSYYDSNHDSLLDLFERVKKLEESKICIIDTDPDDTEKTALYAITKVGYSTIIVSLTEDELAVIDSFIDWADLDDDFSVEKLDQDYTPIVWRNKE